jgi:hypothetical protein
MRLHVAAVAFVAVFVLMYGNAQVTGAGHTSIISDSSSRVDVVVQYGVDSSGLKDVTAELNDALRNATRDSTVYVPPGRYLISSSLLMHSDTALQCAPGAVFVASGTWESLGNADPALYAGFAGITNENFRATKISDNNLRIEGCSFDYAALLGKGGGQHAIRFRMASHIRIRGVNCSNVGDCTAMLATDDSVVMDSKASGIRNACWDHWEAPKRMLVHSNWCSTRTHGVLVTGTNTYGSAGGQSVGIAFDATITDNVIVMERASGAGIWLNGLNAPGAGASNSIVSRNIVRIEGPHGTCIKVSGAGMDNEVIGNTCVAKDGTAQVGVFVGAGGDEGGRPYNTLVFNNTFEGLTVSTTDIGVINVSGRSDRIIRNRVRDGSYPFPLYVHGRNQVTLENEVSPGTSGIINSAGASDLSVDGEHH